MLRSGRVSRGARPFPSSWNITLLSPDLHQKPGSSPPEDRGEETIATVPVGKGPHKTFRSDQPRLKVWPHYLERRGFHKAPYHPLVFLRFYRTSGIDQPAARRYRPSSGMEESELTLGQPRYFGRRQPPLNLRVRAKRSCTRARSVDEDAVKSRCRPGERQIARPIEHYRIDRSGAEPFAN